MQHLHLQDGQKNTKLQCIENVPVPTVDKLDVRVDVRSAATATSNDSVRYERDWVFAFI